MYLLSRVLLSPSIKPIRGCTSHSTVSASRGGRGCTPRSHSSAPWGQPIALRAVLFQLPVGARVTTCGCYFNRNQHKQVRGGTIDVERARRTTKTPWMYSTLATRLFYSPPSPFPCPSASSSFRAISSRFAALRRRTVSGSSPTIPRLCVRVGFCASTKYFSPTRLRVG